MSEITLKSRIQEDMKAAMRAHDKGRLSAIRLILAAIKQREVDERIELKDADVLAVLNKMVKQRRDSITQFQAGNREDLVAIEQLELDVIANYLPKPLSEAAINIFSSSAVGFLPKIFFQNFPEASSNFANALFGKGCHRLQWLFKFVKCKHWQLGVNQ